MNYAREQLTTFGANTPAEGLRQVPSFVGNTETENNSKRGTGAAQVNLRALGSRNTLTMINGRRAFSFEDINALPLGFIESVEILKDGASATYGADAVAGVVNFKLRHAVKGGEIDLLYGNTNLGVANDAAVRTGYLVSGLAGDKYNLTVGASYYDRAAIFARDTFLSSLADRRRLGGDNVGSPQFPGRILATTTAIRSASDFQRMRFSTGSWSIGPTLRTGSKTIAITFRRRTDLISANLRRRSRRRNAPAFFSMANTSFSRKTTSRSSPPRFTRTRSSSTRSRPRASLCPVTWHAAALTTRSKRFRQSTLSATPLTHAPVFSQRLNSVSYASIEAGNRERTYDSDFYHLIAGLKGEFAKDYFWEIGYVFDQNDLVRTDTGDQRFSLLAPAVANGSFNPFVGLDAPRQGTLNGFTYDNAAALRAAGYKATSKTETQDQLLDGKIGGRAFTGLPQGGVNFVVGFELRRQELSQNADPILVADDGLGFEADTKFKAEQKVAAAYLELNIPFVSSTMNVPFVYSFDFTFAYRYERFEMSGIDPADGITESKQILQTDVPKFAVRWAPVKDLTLRASYSRSFRAPTLFEFFEPRTENSSLFPLLFDPLNPGGRAFVQPPGGTIIGGSVDLQPERTDNYSAGFVFTPRQIPNLTVTADYYQLNSEGVVITGFAQGAVVRNAADGSFADRVIRDANGTLQQVLDFPFNAARKAVEGIDITAVYEYPTDNFGKFTIAAAYNHLLRFNLQVIETAGFTNALGRFYSDSPFIPGSLPYNKGYVQTQWDYKGFQLINTFNYIGDYKDFGALVNHSDLVLPLGGPCKHPIHAHARRESVSDVRYAGLLHLHGAASGGWRRRRERDWEGNGIDAQSAPLAAMARSDHDSNWREQHLRLAAALQRRCSWKERQLRYFALLDPRPLLLSRLE